jgi:methylmalonyl-CoA mutase N-terminal domain/subunit
VASLRSASGAAADAERSLGNVRRAAESNRNVFPALLDAADARASVGEIMAALADVFGRHTPHEA